MSTAGAGGMTQYGYADSLSGLMGSGPGSIAAPSTMPNSVPGGMGFNPMTMMMAGGMGNSMMQNSRSTPPQPMAPAMMLPAMPQGPAKTIPAPQFPESGPSKTIKSAIQNMDPSSLDALIQGFLRGMR